MANTSTGQGAVPAPPHRTQFFQNGQPTAELKNYLQSVGLSQDFFTNLVKALPILALTLPWTQWFQAVGDHVNSASDLALLGASTDETARGALANQALVQSLLSILQPGQQREAVQQLLAVYFDDAPRPVEDNSILAYALCQSDRGPEQDIVEFAAALVDGSPRTDFRTFVIEDTHANRIANYPAPAYEVGQLFWETDRTILYIVSAAKTWLYVSGIMSDVQANIATIAGGLAASDTGLLLNVTDFGHALQWTGAAFAFAPGEIGSGYIQSFVQAPNAGIWQICDGTATTYLKGDGTTGAFTTPNASSHYAKMTNGGYGGIVGKSGNTADESAHTHSVTIANNAGTVLSGPNDVAAAQTVASGAGTAHHHTPGSVELDHLEMLPYFRR